MLRRRIKGKKRRHSPFVIYALIIYAMLFIPPLIAYAFSAAADGAGDMTEKPYAAAEAVSHSAEKKAGGENAGGIKNTTASVLDSKSGKAGNTTIAVLDSKSGKTGNTTVAVLDTKSGKTEEKELEEYLCGVVAAEMPASYETEALKAQAVAARSYIRAMAEEKSSAHPEAAVCTSAMHCNAYSSRDEALKKWGADGSELYSKIWGAVRATAGEYMVCGGKPVKAFYFALSNGRTENAEEVWSSPLPYIEGRDSGFDKEASGFVSYAELDGGELEKRLKTLDGGFKYGKGLNVSDIKLTGGGRVKSLKINNAVFSGSDIRSVLGLKSADFSITQEGDKIRFTVRGNGHGVGMSQYGANCLAKRGMSYRDILSYYYKDIEIITQ